MTIEERNQKVLDNLKLVHFRIHYLYPNAIKNSELYSDFFQSGVLGLIEGLEHFDENKEGAFCSYMIYWIDSNIKNFSRRNRFFKIPSDIYYKTIKYKSLSENQYMEDSEIKEIMNLTDNEIKNCKIASKRLTTESTDGINTADYKFYINPETKILHKEISNKLFESLNKLSEKDQELVIQYYGFTDKKISLAEIGRKENQTRQNIERRKRQIIRTLRKEKELMAIA